MIRSNDDEHRRLRKHMNKMVEATRKSRDKDSEVLTQLRIAIAAMQAADRVRHGEASYAGITQVTGAGGGGGGGQPDPLAGVHIDPEPPRSHRERRAQAAKASADAEEAVRKATQMQVELRSEDPLGGLEGL